MCNSELAKYLCCPSTYHNIYAAMANMNKEELIKLRYDLIGYNNNIPLHMTLDVRLTDAIAKYD